MHRMVWIVLGWGLAFSIAVSLYLRLVGITNLVGAALVGLTPLLVIPLVMLFASAWMSYHGPLRIVALVLAVWYFFTFTFVGSIFGCGADDPATLTHSDDEISIYNHNVFYLEGNPAEVAAAIIEADPDVIVLQEVWPGFIAALENEVSLTRYRFRANEPRDSALGLATWSRWPIDEARMHSPAANPVLTTVIDGPGSLHGNGSFTVHNVHTTAPQVSSSQWDDDLEALARTDRTNPSIMSGDFNASSDHRQFRSILESGWTDVHEPKGCGFDATWPSGALSPTPLLRLDHVLVTNHFHVHDTRIGQAAGSDHRAVITKIHFE